MTDQSPQNIVNFEDYQVQRLSLKLTPEIYLSIIQSPKRGQGVMGNKQQGTVEVCFTNNKGELINEQPVGYLNGAGLTRLLIAFWETNLQELDFGESDD